MSEKITITEKQKRNAVEILVESDYYNDNQIYTKSLNKDNE